MYYVSTCHYGLVIKVQIIFITIANYVIYFAVEKVGGRGGSRNK